AYRQLVHALQTELHFKNLTVSVNSNGNLAFDFSCSGGDGGCKAGGEAIANANGGMEFGEGADTVWAMPDSAINYVTGGDRNYAWSEDRGRTVYIRRSGTLEVRRGGTLAWRNNNPGNLRGAPTQIGTNHSLSGQFAIFNSPEIGRQAEMDLIFGPRYADLTIADAMYIYAPPSENDTEAYIANIVDSTGLDRTTVLSTLDSAQRQSFMDAIAAHENVTEGSSETYIYNPFGP
ncbi:MAG TPA: hypothetical protein VHC20_08170, partial [Candidatus Paceibacterota bacterium]|nr:hypothetical protein [Candidatus Paceibacterota bacterium]